jgi:surface polysaccharide O-acyltransferase-like enzyme
VENTPAYFSEIVYLRAIAILAVIAIHTSAYYSIMERATFLTFLYMSVDTISHFAVPLFVCISGFVLYNKYQGSYSRGKFYKKRFLSVIPQYLVFSLIAVLFDFIGTVYFGESWKRSIPDIMYQILTGTAFYHLWFFVLIIQLYVLYPVIEKVFSWCAGKNKIPELLFLCYAIQLVLSLLSIDETSLVWTATLFLGYMFYFVLGMYIRSLRVQLPSLDHARKYSGILFVFLVFATVIGIGILYKSYFRIDFSLPFGIISAVDTPAYILALFTLCLLVAVKISRWKENLWAKSLQLIGDFSFGIYLVHAFIMVIFVSIISPKIGFTVYHPLFFPVVFLIVLISSVCVVYILRKVPYHEFVIGT